MRAFRRSFGDIISRQLDFFAEEHAELLDDCRSALHSYAEADRDEAGEHYERFGDLQEEVNETLQEIRDSYAATLAGQEAERYLEEFDGAAGKRFRGIWLASDY